MKEEQTALKSIVRNTWATRHKTPELNQVLRERVKRLRTISKCLWICLAG